MSAIPQTSSRALSERILEPLRLVAWRNWIARLGKGVLQIAVVSLAVWLIAAVLIGFFPKTPWVLRAMLAALAWLTLLASIVYFLRPALRRQSWSRVAQEVESSLSDQQELLSSAVELSNDRDPRYAGSAELVAHLMQQAEAAAKEVHPEQIVSYRDLRRWGIGTAPLVLAWLLLLPLWPTPMFRGLRQLLLPWRFGPTAASIDIAVKPGDITLAEGDPLRITAEINDPANSNGPVPAASLLFRYPSGQITSTEMLRAGPHGFELATEHIATNLQYSVNAPEGHSAWFAVTVKPRPAVAGITVRYTYPSYTHLPPKTESRPDGSIDAVVGTEAMLTIRSSQPLSDQSRLVLTDDGASAAGLQSLPLKLVTPGEYSAPIAIVRSGQYRIELVSADGLTGRETQSHTITARVDQPPAIAITSPAVKISLPPDDTAPVAFRASDDFGLAKIEAIVQVDGESPEVFSVPMAMAGARQTEGVWKLSIPYQLARHHLTDANRIAYQLRATDTRIPDPQSTLTPRQIIEIDHSYKESFAAKKEADAIKNLTEAITKAIKELGDESSAVDPLVKTKVARLFAAAEKRNTTAIKENVIKTGKDLEAAADANQEGPFAEMAAKVKAVVAGPIFGAAGDVAAALLNLSDPQQRQKSLVDSAEKLASARKQLEALLPKLEQEAKTQELARTLTDMARHEQQLAKALEQKEAAKNNDRGREIQNQAQLRQRLDEILSKNQDLNTPQARDAAQRNQQLIQKVEQLQQAQKPLESLPAKQQAVNDAQAKVNEIAKAQEALNAKVADFAKKDQPLVKDANAQLPSPQQLQNIVKGLEDPSRATQANAEQQQAAAQLKTAAQQLDQAAKDNSPIAQAQARDKQDADHAAQAAELAKEIAKQIEAAKADDGAKKDPNRAKELANQVKQREEQLARQLEQQANDMKVRDPKQKAAIEAAQKEIAQALQTGAQKDDNVEKAEQADQQLADAAEKLASAAEQADAQGAEERKDLAAAETEAKELAAEQKDLADAATKATQAMAQARQQQGDEQALQQQEQQAAQQTDQVANEAGQTQQQEQQAAPEMAQRAADAKAALKEASAHEQKAAAAAKTKNAAEAAKEQRAAEQALARAEQALRGLPDPGDAVAQNDPAAGDPSGSDPSGNGDGDPNTPAGDAANGDPSADKAEMAKGDQAGDKADAGQGAGASGKPDAGDASPSDGASERATGSEASPADKNSGQPKTGSDAAGTPKAGSPGDGDPSAQAGKSAVKRSPKAPAAKTAGQHPAQPPASPRQLMQQAAAQVQVARQAQDEAVNAQRPAAARQAAQALRDAARDLQQSTHPDPGQLAMNNNPASGAPASGQPASGTPRPPSGSPPSAGTPGHDSGTEPGSDPASASGTQPGMNPNSQVKDGHGINVAAMARVDARPESIKQLGVSASDWAKLPPMTRQDLLNAAQQGGPPEYQEMIRNYFVRISKLQADGTMAK